MQMPKVNCRYGAPMGRPDCTDGLDKPARCFRLRFYDGAYDDGGAYWGAPANVYCATNNNGLRLFTRAADRQDAKTRLRTRYPAIKWVN